MPRVAPATPGRAAPLTRILAGRIWTRGRLAPMEIGIDDAGRIRALSRSLTGAPRTDVGESVILPAATDLHVHFRDPGGPDEVEDLGSGTLGAALGGVTLVGDMPNNPHPISDADRLHEKEVRVLGRAAVDVLLYAEPSNSRHLEDLARVAGAFKVYLSPTTGIEEVPTDAESADLFARLSELDLPVAVHAEDPAKFATGDTPRDPTGWDRDRPIAAESRAVDRVLGAPPRLRLHVAHVTTGETVQRLRGAGVSFEATPHHLLLSERSGNDARFKVNPPLRPERERQGLWDAFRRGEVPCLASDHAPHALEAKELPFDRAPAGMPGVETMLPLLLARSRQGDLDLGTLLAAACDRPARWLGQPLGRIAIGHRANLLVVDFRDRRRISGRTLHAPCGWTAFEGWEGIFPRDHYRDGERIVEDGEFVGAKTGTVVRPEYAPSAGTSR
jgi:dihydroorotase